MIKRWHEPMQQWARERGLELLPDGLLPPWTRVLARGTAGSYAIVKLLPPPMCMPTRSG